MRRVCRTLPSIVSKGPPEIRSFVSGSSAGRRDTRFTTPPIAPVPARAAPGPRVTCTASRTSRQIVDRSVRLVSEDSRRTPSRKTGTCWALEPRIEISTGSPAPPKFRICSPGTPSSSSSSRTPSSSPLSASKLTIAAPARTSASARSSPTTIISSTGPSAPSAPASSARERAGQRPSVRPRSAVAASCAARGRISFGPVCPAPATGEPCQAKAEQ